MRVYHDAEGQILYTLTPRGGFEPAPGLFIEVPDEAEVDPLRHRVSDGALELVVAMTEDLRGQMLEQVNCARGAARSRYITVLPGQDMVYQDKERQGLAFLADPAPEPSDYPAIYAEVGTTAPSAYEVAQVYVNLAAVWRQISALIEGAALGALAVIETATTLAEAEAAMSALAAALEAINGLA